MADALMASETPSPPLANGAVAPSASPAPGTPEAAEAERISPKFAALARKEAAAVRKLQEATTRQQQMDAREEALKAREAKLQEWESLKGNPLKAMEALGTDYSQLTQTMLNSGQPTAEQQIKVLHAQIEELKNGLTEKEKRQAEAAEKAAQNDAEKMDADFKGEIHSRLQEKKESHPLTHMYNRVDLAYAVIDHHYNQTLEAKGVGEIMDIDTALDKVEAYLLEEAKKVQKLLAEKEPAKPVSSPAAARRFQLPESQVWVEKPIKTLSDSRIATSVPSQPTHYLSDDERTERAAARIRAFREKR